MSTTETTTTETTTETSERAPKTPCSNAELAQRVDEVLQLRINGAEMADLEALSVEKGWNVSRRQLWNYVFKADDLIEEFFEKDRGKLLRRHVVQRRRLYAHAMQDGAWRDALAILDSEAKLMNLFPANRHELSGPGGRPLLSPQVGDMTDEELEAIARAGGDGAADAPALPAPAGIVHDVHIPEVCE